MFYNFLQSQKAYDPIDVTDDGIIIFSSELHLAKVRAPISFKEDESETSSSDTHS